MDKFNHKWDSSKLGLMKCAIEWKDDTTLWKRYEYNPKLSSQTTTAFYKRYCSGN